MQKQERFQGLDYLRAISCIAIIFIHVLSSGFLMYDRELTLAGTVAYRAVLNNLMWAVPCFIMITGALLLNPEKKIGASKLFSGYVLRLLKAVVLFGTLYVMLEIIFNPEQRTLQHLWEGLFEIFTGDTWAHMWYLYCMIGLYLLLPFYKKIAEHSSKKELTYLLIVYLVFRSLVPLLKIANIDCGFYIHVSTIYPFWLFLGYYIRQYGLQKNGRFYLTLFAGATVLITALTWIRWTWNLEAIERLFGYSSILVIIQTAGIAGCFFKIRGDALSHAKRVLLKINQHSFGIYLIHMIYVRFIYKHLFFEPFSHGGFFAITGMVLVCLILSYVTDWLLRKVPLFQQVL